MPEEDEYLSVAAVARMFDVTLPTVRVWIAEGRLPAYKPGKSFRIRRADALALMRQTRDPGASRDVWSRPATQLRRPNRSEAPDGIWSEPSAPIPTLRRRPR